VLKLRCGVRCDLQGGGGRRIAIEGLEEILKLQKIGERKVGG
jgi:hypothetical protein